MIIYMPLNQVTVRWNGWVGEPGYNTFYFLAGSPPPLAALKTFYEAIKSFIPSTVKFTFPGAGNTINETDGSLAGAWTAAAPAITTATGSGNNMGPAGFVVEWTTGTVADGRRPVGKTFFSPGSSTLLDATGTLVDANVVTIGSAALAFITAAAGSLQIWHRPKKQKAPPHSIIRTGSTVTVTGFNVPDKVTVMRSRRQ